MVAPVDGVLPVWQTSLCGFSPLFSLLAFGDYYYPILQIKKLKLKKIKSLVQSHILELEPDYGHGCSDQTVG